MATVSFNPLVAVDFTTLSTTRSTIDVNNATSYDFDTSDGTDIDMEGTGLTYDGSPNVTAGTITRIDIDIASNQGAVNGGDINISGLNIVATSDLGNIDNGSFSLFGIALQGNDTFLMSGLTEDVDTPTATNRIFGDDLSNLILFVIGGTNTNTGGNDVFSSADNRLEVSGDVWSVNTSTSFSATYTGGNDTYFGTITEEFHRVAGDAWIVDRTGTGQMTLNGGDDDIDLGGNSSGSSFIAGDVNEMNNGIVNGGNDELVSDDSATPEVAGDVRIYNGGTLNAGDDVITASNSSRIGGDVMFLNAPVPAGVFTITGGNDEIYGGGGDDIIAGDVYDRNSAVDNIIIGGDDFIVGGAGNDYLFGEVMFGDGLTDVSGGNDTIFGGAGSDEVRGQTGNDILDGGSGDDTVDGGSGNDTVKGGTGADKLFGGAGNDTFDVDNVGDKVDESTVGSDGTDKVISSVSFSLSNAAQALGDIENLTLVGTAVTGVGNLLANTIAGNSESNTLNGGDGNDTISGGSGSDTIDGGTGADAMTGGSGDDTFFIDNADDDVNESSGGGTDTVQSSINYTLGSNVEKLTLIGSDNINGTGNSLANTMIGNSGNNTLNGGTGADAMTGGNGNDTYVIDNAGDTVTEVSGEGTDLIQSSFTFALASNFEKLTLTGSGDINGTGNSGANTVTGNSGVNTLSGGSNNDTLKGGSGNDVLVGGSGTDKLYGEAGADRFDFNATTETLPTASDRDIIYDFSQSQGDRIDLATIDANTAAAGNQAFVFKGTAAFSGAVGELRYTKAASDTYIYGDINGDKVTDFSIRLDDAITLVAADFVL